MEKIISKKWLTAAMLCGILGCLCYGSGDWLMIYGNTAYSGKLFWLTDGVAQIQAWRNSLAMVLAFPGIIFYGIALFYLERFCISLLVLCSCQRQNKTPQMDGSWECTGVLSALVYCKMSAS